jgi:hypothetical protein
MSITLFPGIFIRYIFHTLTKDEANVPQVGQTKKKTGTVQPHLFELLNV